MKIGRNNKQILRFLDIHKQFLIATILSIFGDKKQLRFERTEEGILSLKKWVLTENCDVVACESTSDFWVPIYDSLINHLTVIVGECWCHARIYPAKNGQRFTLKLIAQLALNNMIKPSRVFSKNQREFRSYIRLRHKLVQKRTDIKNVAHAILASEMFRLNDVLTDIFGKDGM